MYQLNGELFLIIGGKKLETPDSSSHFRDQKVAWLWMFISALTGVRQTIICNQL